MMHMMHDITQYHASYCQIVAAVAVVAEWLSG
jgi:hypothetical protein